MDIIDAILLGFIQGITEFLPISSSGHLVIGNHFLGIHNNNILFEVFVHLGTLVAIFYFYKNEIFKTFKGIITKQKESLNYLSLLIFATIPAVLIGVLFANQIKDFYNIQWVSIFFIITGIILFLSKFSTTKQSQITFFYAFIIGFSQAIAILPGISRSGITIGVALLLGIHKAEATKFSFFMAIPVIIGAVLLEIITINDMYLIELDNLIAGFLTSAIIGYFSISLLIKLINKLHFWKFSFYVWSISFIINYYV